jgi:PAS domain S-box-containing protein
MDLLTILVFTALPVLLLGASVGLSVAYNKLQSQREVSERDRESYLGVLESSNDALFVINFVNGAIHQANAQAAKLLGYSPEELATRTIFQLHPPEFLHRSADRIADAWEQKGLIYEDIPLVHANGTVIPVESSVKVSSYRGRPAIILFARDIQERLALQGEVEAQQAVVREQNRELVAGIRYAQRIQRAVLPDAERLQDHFPESFILFRPRDIVSGDLYWFGERDGRVVVAAADCTGHGVPGALLSLIGASLFQEMVMEKGNLDPATILDGARDGMIAALGRNDESDQRDGMNVGLVTIDRAASTLAYAGAYGPLYIIRKGELIEHKGDRMPIGLHAGEITPFQRFDIPLEPGDRIYLFSDGMPDQFGGPDGKKLRSAGLKRWLLEIATLPMDEQHQALSDRFRMWKGEEEQVDDVLLIGIAV